MAESKLDPQKAAKYISIDATAYAGLTADQINKSQVVEEDAHPFVPEANEALDGLRDIWLEEFS